MAHHLFIAAASAGFLLAGCAVDETTGERTLKFAAAGAAGGFVYDQLSR